MNLIHINTMKMKLTIGALACFVLGSCASMSDYNTVNSSQVGVPQQAFAATVTSARQVTQESSASTRNMGTLIGAGIGVGGGQLLGSGKGRAASTIGMAAAGALAGRYLADSMGRTKCQELTVEVDGTGAMYSFVQPIYKQIGEISVGTHGVYYHGTGAHFVPDGMTL